jgi:hypothetical protein
VSWRGGELERARVSSRLGRPLTVRCRGVELCADRALAAGQAVVFGR